jgi:hypothetical protein
VGGPEWVEIARNPDCAPGTWWWLEGTLGPVVCCAQCQQPHLIDNRDGQGHVVGEDGKVRPSVECMRCGWHVKVQLAGWDGKPCTKEGA